MTAAIDQLRKRMDDGVLALRLVGSPTPVFHWCRENPTIAAKLLEDCADRAAACDRYREACEAVSRAIPANWASNGNRNQQVAYEKLTEALYGNGETG